MANTTTTVQGFIGYIRIQTVNTRRGETTVANLSVGTRVSKDKVDWQAVVLWGALADSARFLRKGDVITVTGYQQKRGKRGVQVVGNQVEQQPRPRRQQAVRQATHAERKPVQLALPF